MQRIRATLARTGTVSALTLSQASYFYILLDSCWNLDERFTHGRLAALDVLACFCPTLSLPHPYSPSQLALSLFNSTAVRRI
ncbi:hypothetical protein ElyMa_003005700 [Elysia marginata]|uniref:Uncharacterized protein n=1 Tax=Elysia marginata TaxID=1093978 RepID=A0AAV4IC48_9GAST|nr:hypothetical protein ElyMa_003005700 [Elysia marginata]